VVAAAHASGHLVGPGLPLQPVRGQVSWATHRGPALPPFPVNGHGHFIPQVPMSDGPAWFCGSTFDRGQVDRDPRGEDHRANQQRLRELLPAVGAQLAPAFSDGSLQVWTGVRCASSDRRPLLGEMAPGLWVSTAMGSRGLTFAALCAELLAAQLHGEPMPLARRLARSLDLRRLER
jgi:tRNA 5-methylaminomethyl-2-thiouridine biosynthesis bifunctional protein